MLKLYEIEKELMELDRLMETWAEEHDGDITDFPLSEEFDRLEGDLASKALAISALIKCFGAERDAIKSVMDGQTKRMTVVANKIERLKSYLQTYVPEGTKYQDGRSQIGWRKSTQVIIDVEPETLPDVYVKIKTEMSPDKKAIGDALKAGQCIDGCRLEVKSNIQIK